MVFSLNGSTNFFRNLKNEICDAMPFFFLLSSSNPSDFILSGIKKKNFPFSNSSGMNF